MGEGKSHVLRHHHVFCSLQSLLNPLRLCVESLHPILIASNIFQVLVVHEFTVTFVTEQPARSYEVSDIEAVEGLATLRAHVALLSQFLWDTRRKLGN